MASDNIRDFPTAGIESRAAAAVHRQALNSPPLSADFSGLKAAEKFRLLQHRLSEMTLLVAELRQELGMGTAPN